MSILRIGGIASGLDTDQIVRDLMRIERLKADRLYQQRQIIQWRKEQFREIINQVRSFRDTYFNLVRPETNLTSPSALKKMQASSGDESIVTVIAGPSAAAGEITFQVIESALKARAVSEDFVTSGGEAGSRLNLSDTMEAVSGKLAGGPLNFDENGSFTLTINGESILIHRSDTLRTVLSRINNSRAGVQISYSSFSDRLTVTAKESGAGYITTDDGGGFFTAFRITPEAETGRIGEAGRDARFIIDGFEGTRSGNTFTIEGITYTINKRIDAEDSSPQVRITVGLDVEGIYRTIEKFVEDYNALIEMIGGKLREEVFRDFPPLTEEQKKELSEKEIELWEQKAKSGLLRGEPLLERMLSEMRRALYDAVEGLHLTEIGIETSRNYREGGKLVLKDGGSALKAAIAQNPDRVAELFSRSSGISYSPNLTAEQRARRYAESGLAHRLSDIINDYIRTTRDQSGRKGHLLERAGIEGDLTEFNNYYDRQIRHLEGQLDRLNERLARREEQYYRQFAAMEKALQQLYAQSDWLFMQMNTLFKK